MKKLVQPNLGQRLHNPLNIRFNPANRWKGMNPNQPQERGFCRFVDDEHGLRAAIVILKNYVERHHLHTLEEIITRWAPPSENDTVIYLACIAGRCKMSPSHNINITRASMDLSYLVSAMARQETGMRFVPSYIQSLRENFNV